MSTPPPHERPAVVRRILAAIFVAAAVLAIVPGWTGEARLALLGDHPQLVATRVSLDPADPARTRVGALTFLGGVALTSRDPAFGGYSSLAVRSDRFLLLSDGGTIVGFRMGGDWRPHHIAFANLPAGPGTGWEKRDRDSESMTLDPHDGRIWAGFEGSNMIWRYAPGFAKAEAHRRPRAMARWPGNGGAESMVRLADGRFVVISETGHVPRRQWRGGRAERLRTRDGLIFPGDPTAGGKPVHFAYEPIGRYDPSDAATLPNGDLLVLDRAFSLPYRFHATVSIVKAAAIGAGGIARPHLLATLDAPLIHDNFEGIAVTREAGATIVWLVSDDNESILQRTLLMKFRLDGH